MGALLFSDEPLCRRGRCRCYRWSQESSPSSRRQDLMRNRRTHGPSPECVLKMRRSDARMFPPSDSAIPCNSHCDGTFVRMAQNGPLRFDLSRDFDCPTISPNLSGLWRGTVSEPRAGKSKPPPKFNISVRFDFRQHMLISPPPADAPYSSGLEAPWRPQASLGVWRVDLQMRVDLRNFWYM